MSAPALNPADRHQIEYLVGDLHVGTPDAEVVREFARRLRKRSGSLAEKPLRKLYYRYALKCHAENRTLFYAVMAWSF